MQRFTEKGRRQYRTHKNSLMSTGAGTTKGYTNHQKNEDCFDIFAIPSQAGPITCAVVADGIAGIWGGHLASQIAVDAIIQSLSEDSEFIQDPHTLDTAINRAVQRANNQVVEKAQRVSSYGKSGTTIALVAIAWEQIQIAYLGDSRIYLLRKGKLHRLTLDHSWVQEALDKEGITEPDLLRHPNRNVISRYLGSKYNIDLEIARHIVLPGHYQKDYLDRAFSQRLTIEAGDSFLLCSDGLTSCLSDQTLEQLLIQHHRRPQRAAAHLVQAALNRLVRDNTTVIVLSTVVSQPTYLQVTQISRLLVSLLGVMLLSVICFLSLIYYQFFLLQVSLETPDVDSSVIVQNQSRPHIPSLTNAPASSIDKSTDNPRNESVENHDVDGLNVDDLDSSDLSILSQGYKLNLAPRTPIGRQLLSQFDQNEHYQVFLFEPLNKTLFDDQIVTFRWTVHPQIAPSITEGLALDIVIWPSNLSQNWETGRSITDVNKLQPIVNMNNQWALSIPLNGMLQPGDYNWTVVVVYKYPYTRISPLGKQIGSFTLNAKATNSE